MLTFCALEAFSFYIDIFFYHLTVWNFNRYSVYCMWSLQQKHKTTKDLNRIAKNPLSYQCPEKLTLILRNYIGNDNQCHDVFFFLPTISWLFYWQWDCHGIFFIFFSLTLRISRVFFLIGMTISSYFLYRQLAAEP